MSTPWFLGPSTRLPWRVQSTEEGFEVWTAWDDSLGTLNNYAIAIGIQREDEAIAIAAVPDLVAAMRGLLKTEFHVDDCGNLKCEICRENEQALDAARAALEKAGVKG